MDEQERLILSRLSLLYVEDNKRIINEVSVIFNNLFNKVYVAEDGIEALEIIDNNQIDIIITDLNMPNMNGIEFMKEIRSTNKKISIIVLTAHADKDLLLEASNLQVDGYLTKPINLNKIIESLKNAISRLDIKTNFILSNGFEYDIFTKTILNNKNNLIELGKKESQLLELLLLNLNKVVSKEEIILNIWDLQDVTDSALKNLLMNLRNKIGKENIKNITGQGWQVLIKNN